MSHEQLSTTTNEHEQKSIDSEEINNETSKNEDPKIPRKDIGSENSLENSLELGSQEIMFFIEIISSKVDLFKISILSELGVYVPEEEIQLVEHQQEAPFHDQDNKIKFNNNQNDKFSHENVSNEFKKMGRFLSQEVETVFSLVYDEFLLRYRYAEKHKEALISQYWKKKLNTKQKELEFLKKVLDKRSKVLSDTRKEYFRELTSLKSKLLKKSMGELIGESDVYSFVDFQGEDMDDVLQQMDNEEREEEIKKLHHQTEVLRKQLRDVEAENEMLHEKTKKEQQKRKQNNSDLNEIESNFKDREDQLKHENEQLSQKYQELMDSLKPWGFEITENGMLQQIGKSTQKEDDSENEDNDTLDDSTDNDPPQLEIERIRGLLEENQNENENLQSDLKSTKMDLAEYKDQVQNLEFHLSSYKTTVSNYEDINENLAEENQELREFKKENLPKIDNLQKSVSELQKDKSSLQKEIHRLHEDFQRKSEGLKPITPPDRKKQKEEDMRKELQKGIAENFERELDDKSETIKQLTQTKENIQLEKEKLEKQYNELESDYKENQQENDEIRDILSRYQEKMIVSKSEEEQQTTPRIQERKKSFKLLSKGIQVKFKKEKKKKLEKFEKHEDENQNKSTTQVPHATEDQLEDQSRKAVNQVNISEQRKVHPLFERLEDRAKSLSDRKLNKLSKIQQERSQMLERVLAATEDVYKNDSQDSNSNIPLHSETQDYHLSSADFSYNNSEFPQIIGKKQMPSSLSRQMTNSPVSQSNKKSDYSSLQDDSQIEWSDFYSSERKDSNRTSEDSSFFPLDRSKSNTPYFWRPVMKRSVTPITTEPRPESRNSSPYRPNSSTGTSHLLLEIPESDSSSSKTDPKNNDELKTNHRFQYRYHSKHHKPHSHISKNHSSSQRRGEPSRYHSTSKKKPGAPHQISLDQELPLAPPPQHSSSKESSAVTRNFSNEYNSRRTRSQLDHRSGSQIQRLRPQRQHFIIRNSGKPF
eukprot:gb/GECH01003812.1/.p1 GENE.gb/GECH01003812.1/~~gb/GECH01003812.1/.p1  ORF type:complete len:988 (+),score=392.39 gb/GECH01003812.1/:1-2964(+)